MWRMYTHTASYFKLIFVGKVVQIFAITAHIGDEANYSLQCFVVLTVR